LLNYFEQDKNSGFDPEPSPDPPNAQISIHSLMGHTTPQTLRVQGVIGKSPVVILVDIESTHNFVQDRVVKVLGLHVQAAHSFLVMVGNGEEIRCDSYCPNVGIKIDPHQFQVDLFVLPLSGADLVLGIQWLKSLGPVLTDYEFLTMKFMKDGKVVQLKGQTKPNLLEATTAQFKRMATIESMHKSFIFKFYP